MEIAVVYHLLNVCESPVEKAEMEYDFSWRSSGKFREQQNIWNGSPVLPDQERILSRRNVPNRNSCSICEKPLTFNASFKLLRPLFSKTELVCQTNGKIEFLLPFALHILWTADRFARVKW